MGTSLSKRTQSRMARKPVARRAASKTNSTGLRKSTAVTRVRAGASKPTRKLVMSAAKTRVGAKVQLKKKPARKPITLSPKKKAAVRTTARATMGRKVARKSVSRIVKSAKAPLKARATKSAKAVKRLTPSRTIKVVKRAAPPPPPPPPEPPRRKVSSAVLRGFEHAVKVFNRRQFAEAKELFESVQERYPQEVEINARAQTYIQVCSQKLARPLSSPRSPDEMYDRGVVALNIGDFTQARSLFEKALRMKPDEPHLLYSLAATYAQTGSLDEALDYLHRSIQMQPRYRSQVISDSDFTQLHNDKRFLEILGVSSPFDLFDSAS